MENLLNSKAKYTFIIGVLTIGLLLGILICQTTTSSSSEAVCDSDYEFIKPNTDCKTMDTKKEELSSLQDDLQEAVEKYTTTRQAHRICVFVRDLKSTSFAGVNDNDTFLMASLLKLPLVIAAYKLAEVEPRVLDQAIKYTGTPNLYDMQSYKPENMLQKGTSYTLKDLAERSLIYSDNTAAQMIVDYFQPGYFDRILKALGIQFRLPDGSDENLATPRTYANVLRLLYNSSYLTPGYSNEIIETLTRTTYKTGALAKIPTSVKIAHKFGERSVFDKNGSLTSRELHECGIVYLEKPFRPYTFCIMTEGQEFESLEKIQQELSYKIYTSMSASK